MLSDNMSKVSILRCENYDPEKLYTALKQAIDLIGGIEKFVNPKQKVLIKPNLLKAAHPDQAVTTHPEFVRAVIRLVKKVSCQIFVGDSPGGLTKIETIYEQCGITQVAHQERIELVKFDRVVNIGDIPFAKVKDEVDVIISLPKFKTHNLTMITAAVKNMFGLVAGLHKVHCHKNAPNFKVFSKEIARIFGLIKPGLNIVDSIVAMEGDGPAQGEPYNLGLIVASSDAVAVDAVLSKIVGIKPQQVTSTEEAYRLGLGQVDLEKVEVFGESLEEVSVDDFILPKIFFLYRMPNFITRTIAKFVPLMLKIDRLKCNNCMICKNICPQGAIQEIDRKLRVDFGRCILCLCCSEICPNNAVCLRFFRRRRRSEK